MPADQFACPSCGKSYKWKPDVAGKKVRCAKCNLKLRVPGGPGEKAEALEPTPSGKGGGGSAPTAPSSASRPPSAGKPARPADDDAYELNLDDDLAGLAPKGPVQPVSLGGGGGAAAGNGKCPGCNAKIKPGAVICLNCGFNLQSGKKMKTAVEVDAGDAAQGKGDAKAKGAPAAPAPVVGSAYSQALAAAAKRSEDEENVGGIGDRFGAAILLGVGAALLLLNAFVLLPSDYLDSYFGSTDFSGRLFYLLGAGISFAFTMPFMLVGIFLVAKMFGSAYGTLFSALAKLAGITAFNIGAGALVDTGMWIVTEGNPGLGGYASYAMQFAIFWGSCAFVFDDMDFMEVFVLYLITNFLPFILGAFLIGMVFAMFM